MTRPADAGHQTRPVGAGAPAHPDLSGARVGIWGLGREGASMVRAAARAGAARIDVVDDVGADTPGAVPGLHVHVGSAHRALLRDCDLVFVSPGVPWRDPFFAGLREDGPPLSSAAQWFLAAYGAQTIGVTGTKGKSTTAAFIGHLLQVLGVPATVAGNIGTPLPDLEPGADEVVVAELSSQQAALLTAAPAVAVLTNLYEDHLDFHGDTAAYYRAKARILGPGCEVLVCSPRVHEQLQAVGGVVLPPRIRLVAPDSGTAPAGQDTVAQDDPAVVGRVMRYGHNRLNTLLAAAAIAETGRPDVTPEQLAGAVDTFPGLPHRLQTVRVTGPIRWIDDTLATTGESVVAALAAMPPDRHIAAIVGGKDRGLNYDQLDAYLLSGARRVSLIQIPGNGTHIGRGYAAAHPQSVHPVADLAAAVRTAAALPGVEVVLLSPGAASYDRYANYVAKSAAFCAHIDELA